MKTTTYSFLVGHYIKMSYFFNESILLIMLLYLYFCGLFIAENDKLI